jgi:hypothetical protein
VPRSGSTWLRDVVEELACGVTEGSPRGGVTLLSPSQPRGEVSAYTGASFDPPLARGAYSPLRPGATVRSQPA